MKINLEDGERIEDLQCKGLKIIQNKNYYTFTSDSVILANFISLKNNDKCVEIGTGCGVIPVLLSAKTSFQNIYAFELQGEMARLAEKNILINKLEEKVSIINDDVRNYNQYFEIYKELYIETKETMHKLDKIVAGKQEGVHT